LFFFFEQGDAVADANAWMPGVAVAGALGRAGAQAECQLLTSAQVQFDLLALDAALEIRLRAVVAQRLERAPVCACAALHEHRRRRLGLDAEEHVALRPAASPGAVVRAEDVRDQRAMQVVRLSRVAPRLRVVHVRNQQ